MDEMGSEQSGAAPDPYALDIFLDQVDAVIRKRTESRADPLQELAWLGLVPAVGEVAAWSSLSEPQWVTLLYKIAGRCPHLASVLSSLRYGIDHTGDSGRVGLAQHAYPVAGQDWQLSLPIAHYCMARWYFADESRLRWVSAASLRPQTGTM